MSDALPLSPGDVIADRYRITDVVGRGGFSTIFRARQKSLGRDVALKVMRNDVETLGGSARSAENLVERFRREAKAVARLNHPATVTLHDFGQTRDGHFFMVLEYVDGHTLNRLASHRLAPKRVVSILTQALGSLAEAHRHGIVHRDVKPSNIMVYEGRSVPDRVKILDFGIAKLVKSTDGETVRKLTGESMVVGTPRYLAPENATGRDPGPATDIYSLGLVAYELLLGEKAVPGNRTMEVLETHLSETFQPFVDRRPAVPEPLRAIVNRMIRKPLDERYECAEEVVADLEELPTFGRAFRETERLPGPPEQSTRPSVVPAPPSGVFSLDSSGAKTTDEPRTSRPDELDANETPGEETRPERPRPRSNRPAASFRSTPIADRNVAAARKMPPEEDAPAVDTAASLAGERPRPITEDSTRKLGTDRPNDESSRPHAPSDRRRGSTADRATFPPGDTLRVTDSRPGSDSLRRNRTTRTDLSKLLLWLSLFTLSAVAATALLCLVL